MSRQLIKTVAQSCTWLYKTVQQLLIDGEDVNAISNANTTPLIIAAWSGHAAVVQQLLAARANVHLTDNRGCAALHMADRYGHPAVITELIAAGADFLATLLCPNTDVPG